MPLTNCEINLFLTWSEDCVISFVTGTTKFKLTDPVVILSTQDNAKLLLQLKSGFKKTINWNKHHPKDSPERQNQYLGFLIDTNFQALYRILVLSFENEYD